MSFESGGATIHKMLTRWQREREADEAWAKANPDIALAWEQAISEEEGRERLAFEMRFQGEQRKELPEHLRACGAKLREIEAITGPDFRQTKAVLAVDEFANHKTATFCLLWGAIGCGKTIAGAHALRYATKRGQMLYGSGRWWADVTMLSRREGLLISAFELSRASVWGRPDDTRLYEKACEVRWLVLDDLGTEVPDEKGYWIQKLHHLVDERHGNKLKTVITTNLDPEKFKARYDERMVDRIREGLSIANAGTQSLRRAKP